jgi:ribosomal protein S18 acetylase RimI-like enzyme
MDIRITLHDLTEQDCPIITTAFTAQRWNKPLAQYQRYYLEQLEGQREVILAKVCGQFAGYVTIVWSSNYPPFREANIPEIVDFNVLIAHRRHGVGTALMDEAERRIAQRSPAAGIGVCLTPDYGPAQILYAQRGYIPDGRGIFQNGRHCRRGDQVVVDDDLALCLTKSLTNLRSS